MALSKYATTGPIATIVVAGALMAAPQTAPLREAIGSKAQDVVGWARSTTSSGSEPLSDYQVLHEVRQYNAAMVAKLAPLQQRFAPKIAVYQKPAADTAAAAPTGPMQKVTLANGRVISVPHRFVDQNVSMNQRMPASLPVPSAQSGEGSVGSN